MTNGDVVIRVAVPLPLDEGLDYLWEGARPRIGCRVRVPVGGRSHIGIVIGHPPASAVGSEKMRPAQEALDTEPVIDARLLEALRWCAGYYHHPLGEVISTALPTLLRRGHSAGAPREISWRLTPAGESVDLTALARRARRQAASLELLSDKDAMTETALRKHGYTRADLRKIAAKGWIESIDRAARQSHSTASDQATAEPALTQDQRNAFAEIDAAGARYNAFLLHGVTGSGKTEVYMRLIAARIRQGLQSLLLVPEISLTPQLVKRLEQRFGQRLAVMHSALTERERLDAWRACRSGAASLIVGTRSAVFAPLRDPGLIVVDEEHDTSFKQVEGFRYSARDLAVYRARQLGIPVLLGSATPSFESLHNAGTGRYRLLRLPRRIGAAGTPRLRVVDLNRHAVRQGLSTPLLIAIEQHLGAGNQIMLFLNRRGFAPVLFCPQCGAAEQCRRCDSRMTIHSATGHLRCHHCGAERALAWACPECGNERIAVGAGTQRVTEELRALFPKAGIARLDRDATSKRGSLAKVLAEVEQGKTQILVGTQMLAKGHDFPNVTLVGVLNADQGLFGTDFRSNERLAQTIIQVAGRAGRADRPGEVLIQSYYPAHPLFDCLRSQDYAGFAEIALAERREAAWPPFSHLVLWRAHATRRAPVFDFLQRLARAARLRPSMVEIHGPAPAAMERRGGRYRAQILLQCAQRAPLHDLLNQLTSQVRAWPQSRRVRWAIDVDPIEL